MSALIPGMCRLCTVRRVFRRRAAHRVCARLLWCPVHLTGEPVTSEEAPGYGLHR